MYSKAPRSEKRQKRATDVETGSYPKAAYESLSEHSYNLKEPDP